MAVFKIDTEKVRRRADFLLSEASRFVAEGNPASFGFQLSDEDAMVAAEAYFLVNEAYKARRQNAGHKTLPTKIAAITALVIATLNPLRPKGEPVTATPTSIYANPLFALRLGCNIVQHALHLQGWMRMQWFCDHLRNDALSGLDGYIEAVRNGGRAVGEPFDIELSLLDLSRIEGRVAFFDVLSQLKILQSKQ